jgi:hypothetical protein
MYFVFWANFHLQNYEFGDKKISSKVGETPLPSKKYGETRGIRGNVVDVAAPAFITYVCDHLPPGSPSLRESCQNWQVLVHVFDRYHWLLRMMQISGKDTGDYKERMDEEIAGGFWILGYRAAWKLRFRYFVRGTIPLMLLFKENAGVKWGSRGIGTISEASVKFLLSSMSVLVELVGYFQLRRHLCTWIEERRLWN